MTAPTVPELPHVTGTHGLVEVTTDLGWCDILLDFRGEPRSDDRHGLFGTIRSGTGTPVHPTGPTGRASWAFDCPKIRMWQDPHGYRYAIAFIDDVANEDFSAADEDPYGRTCSSVLPVMFNRRFLSGVPATDARDAFEAWAPRVEQLARTYAALSRQGIPVYADEAILDLSLAGVGLTRTPAVDRLISRYGHGIAYAVDWWRVNGYSAEDINRYVHLFDMVEDERIAERGLPSGDLHTLIRWLDGHEPSLHGIPRKTIVDFFLADTDGGMSTCDDPQVWTPALIREMYDIGLTVPAWWRLFRRAREADDWARRSVPTVADHVRTWAGVMPLQHAVYYMADRVPLNDAAAAYATGHFDAAAFEVLWALVDNEGRLADMLGTQSDTNHWIENLQREVDQILAQTRPHVPDASNGGRVGEPHPHEVTA